MNMDDLMHHSHDFLELKEFKDMTLGEIIEKIGIKDRKVNKIEMSCRPVLIKSTESSVYFPVYASKNHCFTFELIDE